MRGSSVNADFELKFRISTVHAVCAWWVIVQNHLSLHWLGSLQASRGVFWVYNGPPDNFWASRASTHQRLLHSPSSYYVQTSPGRKQWRFAISADHSEEQWHCMNDACPIRQFTMSVVEIQLWGACRKFCSLTVIIVIHFFRMLTAMTSLQY